MANSKSAIPLIAGAGALLLLSGDSKKKKKPSGKSRWGVSVSQDCQKVKITDQKLFNKFLFGAFNELVEIDPTLSLIQMTDALFGDVAPNCSGFPEKPESEYVSELYAIIARAIGSFMINDPRVKMNMGSLIDDATKIKFVDWYRAWRNYPSPEVPATPPSEVAFSSDYSKYEIGPKWYNDTIVPYLLSAIASGKAETVYEDFIEDHGVQVGQFVFPIADLPENKNTVKDFLDKIEEAFEEAASSI